MEAWHQRHPGGLWLHASVAVLVGFGSVATGLVVSFRLLLLLMTSQVWDL